MLSEPTLSSPCECAGSDCCWIALQLWTCQTLGSNQTLTQLSTVTGGVRLDPSSAPLWAGLGSCATHPKHQEYAFTRSLQLDPKSAHTWAALGRLYMECGARHLADTCFTQARSQEPADPATWAAMGALAGLSPTGGPTPALPTSHCLNS